MSATVQRPRTGQLVKGRDAGGFRWALEGRKVNAGTGLELAIPTARVECPKDCDWEIDCEACRGDGFVCGGMVWIRVRLEASDIAWVTLGTARGESDGCRFGDDARFRAEPRMRFRWPPGDARGHKLDPDWVRV